MSYNDGQIDASREEQRLVAARAKLRAELRAEYIKQWSNPHVHSESGGGYLFDPAMQRWMSMRANQYYYFKANSKTAIYPLMLFGAIGLCSWGLIRRRTKKENLYRTGQVSYRDRKNKFI